MNDGKIECAGRRTQDSFVFESSQPVRLLTGARKRRGKGFAQRFQVTRSWSTLNLLRSKPEVRVISPSGNSRLLKFSDEEYARFARSADLWELRPTEAAMLEAYVFPHVDQADHQYIKAKLF